MTPFEIILSGLFGGTAVTAIMTWVQRKWSKKDKSDEEQGVVAVREIDSKDASEASLWKQVDTLTETVSTLQSQRIDDWKQFEQSRRDDAQRCYEVSTKLALSEFHRELMHKENESLKTELVGRGVEVRELREAIRSLEIRLTVAETRLGSSPSSAQ